MKEPITYWRATVVKDIAEGLIAEGLIAEFHEHLEDATILYIFSLQASPDHESSHGEDSSR